MEPVAVRILHPAAAPDAPELVTILADARLASATRIGAEFQAAGATDVAMVSGPADGLPFGARLRGITTKVTEELGAEAGLVVLGSGSIPLARGRFLRELVGVAASGERIALANSFYSADVVAIGVAANLASVPDLPSDNGLPRWLREERGYEVGDRRARWRLGMDLDSPLDVALMTNEPPAGLVALLGHVRERAGRLRALAADASKQLVIAGRTSSATLRWLERETASRTRALIEERGLRAIGVGGEGQRPPRSTLALLVDDPGPERFGSVLAELGDGAIVDSRVLLAHRLGADEAKWPSPEDRYASDLLLPERIADPWLAAITASALDASIPVLLGGHTLVGPGVRLVLGGDT
ncbi:MAG TPA: hypothetical protein VM451_10500 [Candidatus Limnocylindria bacterium]|nr:hypothetical protein [Candidatus Limnocylindria bacterium]